MSKRVLVISRNAWSNKISTGNTLSNFFNGWPEDKIANIYCRAEVIDNSVCSKYYRITEFDLVNSIFHNQTAGKVIHSEAREKTSKEKAIGKSSKLYSFFRRNKLIVFLWFREALWKFGNWKSAELDEFLGKFDPEIIYMPIYDCWYMFDLLFYVWNKTSAKVVLFTGDDMYSMHKFSLSPLFWINHLILRRKIRRAVAISSKRYCLMPEQAEEYQSYFNKEFNLLTKECAAETVILPRPEHKKMQFVYTGNIDQGRFESLCQLGENLSKFETNPELRIYSGSSLSAKMMRQFEKIPAINFMGEISSEKVKSVQQEADVVVHVESLKLKERLQTRLSFSTKIIDYMSNHCCILAIGWEGASSIKYLERNELAMIVTDYSQLAVKVKKLIEDKSLRDELADRAYVYVQANHAFGENRKMLEKDFEEISER